MLLTSANCATVTHWKKTMPTSKISSELAYQQEKHYPILEPRTKIVLVLGPRSLNRHKLNNIYKVLEISSSDIIWGDGKTDCNLPQRIVRVKLGYRLPIFAKNCSHFSTNFKLYPSTETYKDLNEKIRNTVGGPSIASTRETVVEGTSYRNQRNCASLLLLLMLVSFVATRCVSQCRLLYKPNGSTTVKSSASHHTKTYCIPLRGCSFEIFTELHQDGELGAM